MKTIEPFASAAQGLARNPLGIIALFIVLVYGFASFVTANASAFQVGERIPLVYFLILFPVLVLGVFGWLVSCHSDKLYGPGDYRNEENFVRLQLRVNSSLTAANVRQSQTAFDENEIAETASIVKEFKLLENRLPSVSWKKKLLWVDDRPENNIYERKAFEEIGLSFSLAQSTDEALEILKGNKFAAIISDMGRREGPQEGYVLLEKLRTAGDKTPFFIYAGSNLPAHKQEAARRGAQGSTNNPRELFVAVTKAIISG